MELRCTISACGREASEVYQGYSLCSGCIALLFEMLTDEDIERLEPQWFRELDRERTREDEAG